MGKDKRQRVDEEEAKEDISPSKKKKLLNGTKASSEENVVITSSSRSKKCSSDTSSKMKSNNKVDIKNMRKEKEDNDDDETEECFREEKSYEEEEEIKEPTLKEPPSSKKKKHKKKRQLSEDHFDDNNDEEAESSMVVEENSLLKKKKKKQKENSEPLLSDEWSYDDRVKLIDNIQAKMNKADRASFMSRTNKLDWSEVAFAEFDPEQCKEEWLKITRKIQKSRTMNDLLADAKIWIVKDFQRKGPMTPFLRFYSDQLNQLKQRKSDFRLNDFAKEMAEKYKNLPDEEKKRYKEEYEKEKADYQKKKKEFDEEHPGVKNDPPKFLSPMMLYIQEKYKEDEMDKSKKEMYDKYRIKWQRMKSSTKLKYINEALANVPQYEKDLEDYCVQHPNYKKPTIKGYITKDEQNLKDELEGKAKPPASVYQYFLKVQKKKYNKLSPADRNKKITESWKNLSKDQKEVYKDQFYQCVKDYEISKEEFKEE